MMRNLRTRTITFAAAILPALLYTASSQAVTNNLSIKGPFSTRDDGSLTNWTATIEKKKTPIFTSSGVIYAPVASNNITLKNNRHEVFDINSDHIDSVTTVPVFEKDDSDTSARSKPSTLFITICGFESDLNDGDGSGTCPWQADAESTFDAHSNAQDYRYRHYLVDWQTHYPSHTQAKNLGKLITGFLKDRNQKWDVFIIGHSRGGIFAHNLASNILGSKNIDKLYTALLDPTAARLLNDVYPSSKRTKTGHTHIAWNYYDNEEFIDNTGIDGLSIAMNTDSDRPISGYNNKVWDAPHGGYADDFFGSPASSGLNNILQNHSNRKSSGTYPYESDDAYLDHLAVVRRGSGLNLDGDLSISSSGVYIDGTVSVDDMPGLTMNVQGSIDGTGVDAHFATAVIAAATTITKDTIATSNNTVIGGYSASLTNGQGLSVAVDSPFASDANLQVSWTSISFDARVAGLEVTQYFEDAADYILEDGVTFLSHSVTNGIRKIFSDVGSALGSIF